MSIISLKKITKTYSSGSVAVDALRGVDLEISQGEFAAIMGSSGSGKSTLMNILGCLDKPTSGNFFLNGEDVSGFSKNRLAEVRNRTLGFVFQNFHLLPRTSALENVELPLLYNRTGISWKEIHNRAKHALEIVGLGDRTHHTPNELSGGQQQRVAIARALVNKPTLLLADEPTGNLDSKTSLEIMDIFQKLNKEGLTILMVTHEADIAQFTRRTIILRDGVIRRDNTHPQHIASEKLQHWVDEAELIFEGDKT